MRCVAGFMRTRNEMVHSALFEMRGGDGGVEVSERGWGANLSWRLSRASCHVIVGHADFEMSVFACYPVKVRLVSRRMAGNNLRLYAYVLLFFWRGRGAVSREHLMDGTFIVCV